MIDRQSINYSLIIYLFIHTLLLSSCKSENTNQNYNSSKKNFSNQTTTDSTLKPIFLGLNPKMTDREFKSQIESLNYDGKLNNGDFNIKSECGDFKFSVSQSINSINLCLDDGESYSKGELNQNEQEKVYLKYKDKAKCITHLFDINNKYNKTSFAIDLSLQSPAYAKINGIDDTKKVKYYYKGNDNSVVISYRLFGNDYANKVKVISIFGKPVEEDSIFNKSSFGIMLCLDYYENTVLDSLLNIADKQSKKINKFYKDLEDETIKQKKIIKENINEL